VSAREAALRALEAELGPGALRREPPIRERHALDGLVPEAVALPSGPELVGALLARAAEAGLAVVPWGSGSRIATGGAPARYDVALSLARLSAILEHDEENLTFTAQAGATLFDAAQRLRPRRQMLAAGWPWERHSLGGLVAANRGVPKRLAYGALRDQLLGVRLALGDGRLARFGGKVLKNVAGYDLTKLVIGSFGAAGVIVETTWKLFALPDGEIHWCGALPSLERAAALAARLFRSPLLPACLFLLDPAAAARLAGLERLNAPPGQALAWVGFDGRAAALRRQIAEIETIAAAEGGALVEVRERLSEAASALLMGEQSPQPETMQVRLGVPPSRLGQVHGMAIAELAERGLSGSAVLDYPAGRITLRVPAPGVSHPVLTDWVRRLRQALAREGGFALLEQAPPALRASLGTWGDLGDAGRLMARLKPSLDPPSILAPGRLIP
jgi:glycolate oxidase FAD binding subunit